MPLPTALPHGPDFCTPRRGARMSLLLAAWLSASCASHTGASDDGINDAGSVATAPELGGTADPEGNASATASAADTNPDPADTSIANPGDAGTVPGLSATVPSVELPPDGGASADWLHDNTVSLRVALPLASQGQILSAETLATQLEGYDPGSLLHCNVSQDANYQTTIDELGGVTWGYGVSALEDQSKPRIVAGYQRYNQLVPVPGAPTDSAGGGVEIVKPDIVAVTESAALFYSQVHGLLMISLETGTPVFKCATQLPGRVDQFFFHEGHLVGMTKNQSATESYLVHFTLAGSELGFTEAISLGNTNILDSRRFNNKLVFYTDLRFDQNVGTGASSDAAQGAAPGPLPPISEIPRNDRALRVFNIGETLQEEMYDTLMDTSVSEAQLFTEQVTADTLPGTQVGEWRGFGQNMWASDKYFVITEQITKTFVEQWNTRDYNVCVESHTNETPYQYCWTEYETRPNPEYVEPDNSGGDRSCQGVTLSDCLVHVAKVSNKTIQVPVAHKCEEQIRYNWVCDRYEVQTAEYPTFYTEASTQLYIYEYADSGFVKLDSSVHEVENQGLDQADIGASVDTITTSTEAFDLAVPGSIQTLYFQNGYLYVISEGILQIYTMGGSSMIRTATLPVVNDSLQSTLFSNTQLFLSDFGWNSGQDSSTLRVIDLTNPAFPRVEGSTHQLPGGHSSIIASDFGIFTIGSVQSFMGQSINALKLGLFSNPVAEETAYLILGTDLAGSWLTQTEAQFFNASSERLLLPYYGQDEEYSQEYRVGVSHIEATAIVSEGAVRVPELVERVRPLPLAEESYLSFAPSSIEWLTPADTEWQTTPVLEYLVPFTVYRLNDADDYVETQRLGNRCRLYFSNAQDINQRANGSYSEEFTCTGWPTAYANRLLFTTGSVEFDASEHSVRLLSDADVEATRAAIAARPYCVLSEELLDNVWVDPNDLPEDAQVKCMSPEEYMQHAGELNTPAPTDNPVD